MNSRKGFRYYIIMFFLSVVALGAYVAYLSIKEGSIDMNLIYSYAPVPLVFTFLLFAFDKVFEMIFPSKFKKEDTEYNKYLKTVGEVISKQCDFSIEGYRRLRENSIFQKSLEQAFRILYKGESEDMNFQFLEKKFKKNTNEYTALLVVIEEVKKMMENS